MSSTIMENTLNGKVVFITGSSIGIGAATAKEFASQGAKVVITYNQSKADAEQVEKECQELSNSETLLVQLDVSKTDSLQNAVKEVVGKFGHIDILVNNAGVLYENKLTDTSFAEIESQIRVNLEGLIKITKESLPYIKGCIVNLASEVGFKAYPGLATYVATKWAVRGFSKTLAGEIDIPVYIVNPGGTATQMNDFAGEPTEKVAAVIADLVSGKIASQSGDDINVWER